MTATTSQQLERPPVLQCSGLTKRYGDHTAVDGLDLTVERGEIFGILGPNGAGKTTSVECAQGLRQPDDGRVRVLGLDPILDRGALRHRVGSQLQQTNLPDRLRVGEAIALFADDREQADRAMNDWGLRQLQRVPFGGLSGGQQQRLFLALALLNDPEVVFLDELTQGLDPAARSDVWALIERVREGGTTVVLVTHFMNEAEALCDRVAVMAKGRLLDLDTPAALIARHGGGVRLRFPAPSDVDAWLGAVPGIAAVNRRAGDVEVRAEPRAIFAIGAELVSRGCVPNEIRVAQPSLEEALISLLDTGSEVQR